MWETREESSRGSGGNSEGSSGFSYRQQTFDVYVGRIPADWSKDNLLELFSPFGEIKSVDLRTGQEFFNGQKIAFVRFSMEENAKNAVDTLIHNPIENVNLQINMAQRSKNKDRQGNIDFNQPRKTYSELKRTNQAESRRARPRRNDTEYGGGYGSQSYYGVPSHYGAPSHGQKKDWNTSSNVDRQKSREDVILVTEVDSPVRFWGQLAKVSVAHNLSTKSEELQLYCPTGLKVADNSHQKNKVYGGLYPVDNLWYRCFIVKFLPQGMVTVRYIDYGNTETIKKETLVELPPNLADARPNAQPYILADCAVSSDPGANEMTYALGIEQLKNLIIGKLVTVKVLSENSQGGMNVVVSCHGDSGKTINEIMQEKGCVQRMKSHIDKGRIEKSVAEKPLNDVHDGSSPGSPGKGSKANSSPELDNLKLTVKFQAETICNLNKLFETVKQQNDDLCSELDQAIKLKTIMSAVTDLHQSRSTTACGQDRTSNIDLAISLVADAEHRLTLNRVESFKKLCSSSDALKSAQESLRTCQDKEKLKEIIEHRNITRQEMLESIKKFLEEISLLNIKDRGQKLEEVLKKLSIFHHRYDGNEQSLEEAIKNFNDWKEKAQQDDVKTVRQKTDDISKKLAKEFVKLAKMLDPDDDLTLKDCGTLDVNSIALQLSEAVAAEVQQNQEGEDPEEIQIIAPLIKCLKKELQQEINDVEELRNRADECTRVQADLDTWLNKEPDVTKILDIRKNLKNVKSKFRHKLADKKDLEESDEAVDAKDLEQVEKDLTDLRAQLHSLLVEEKTALEELADVAAENFPELPIQFPEFGLQKFIASNGLAKQGWELTYFSHGVMEKVTTSSQSEVAFATVFSGEKCLLKEFSLEDIKDIESFEAQAAAYSRVEHLNLMKVEALFYDKTHRKAFIQLPYYETSLRMWLQRNPSDKAKRDVICHVIRALFALHKAGITHGSVVMDNIYVDANGRGILGEYCFIRDTQERVSLTAELLLKDSAPVSCDTSPVFDMFCLGEIAWVTFLGDEAVPRDLTSLRKHSQSKAISSLLTFLLALNGGVRPTSKQLTLHPFFFDENYFDMDKTLPQPPKQVSPPKPVEKPLPEENTQPEEKPLPEEKPAEGNPSPEENNLSEESTPHTQSTLPDQSALPEKSTPAEQNSLPEQSTPPGQSTIPEESNPADNQPQSEETTPTGEVLPDVSPSIEEALPEEYAMTQRRPLLDENGLETAVKGNGTLDGDLPENIEQENTSECWEQELHNEVEVGGTQE